MLKGSTGTQLHITRLKKPRPTKCDCYNCMWNTYLNINTMEIQCQRHKGKIYKKSLTLCSEYSYEKSKIKRNPDNKEKRLTCKDYNYGWCKVAKKKLKKNCKCALLENKKCYRG